MYNIIPLIVILLCLAGILAIIIKKLPLLAVFDVNSIPEEKEAETKKKIMEERLERKAKVYWNKISPFFKLISNFFARKFKAVQGWVSKIEEKYKTKAKKGVLVTKEEFASQENEIERLLNEGEDLIKTEEFETAEKKFIEILSLDAKNIAAFHGLGDLYFLQKQYDEAINTYKHILKIDKEDDQAYFGLAEIFYILKNYDQALANIKMALDVEAKNPKYLDLLLEISIIIKNKELAEETLSKLEEVNPDNAKIDEFKDRISAF